MPLLLLPRSAEEGSSAASPTTSAGTGVAGTRTTTDDARGWRTALLVVGGGVAVAAVVAAVVAARRRRRRRRAEKEQPPRLARLFDAVDALNAQDPRPDAGSGEPQELVYGRRMSARLDAFMPDAPDALRAACRAQHVARWRVPRAEFPPTRAGYLAWRKKLQRMHADVARELMTRVGGFSEEEMETVRSVLCKEDIKGDPLGQALEDVAALVFLEFYLGGFSSQQDREKMVSILRKTWLKMSDAGHAAALRLDLPGAQLELVRAALADASTAAPGGGDD